jgi:hypothetical protein
MVPALWLALRISRRLASGQPHAVS